MLITFDGSFEGFLCIVYSYYYEKIRPVSIQLEDECQQVLDAEEYYIATDYHKAVKVQKGIRKKISRQADAYITYAFLAGDGHMDLLRYIIFGFKVGKIVDNHLQKDFVINVHKKARYVAGEAHLLYGFCRFAETATGVFYCEISPKNNVLSILAEYFSDRMMNQAWVIHDTKRNRAAIYDGNRYVVEEVPRDVNVDICSKEGDIKDLWGAFFNALWIEERTNKALQRNMLPLHFRKHMTEFNLTNP